MLHLARKAFYPAPPPFPLLHVDTTWKFQDDVRAARPDGARGRHGAARPPESRGRGARHQSVRSRPAPHRHVEDRRAEAGARPVRLRRGLRRRAARRGEEPRQGAHLLASAPPTIAGIRRTSGPNCGTSTMRARRRARASASSRSPTGPSSTSGNISSSKDIPIVPLYFAAPRPTVERDGLLLMVDDDRFPLRAGEVPVERSIRFRTLGCYPLTGAVESEATTLPRGDPGDAADHHLRAPGPRDRQGCGRREHGEEEAGGLFLMARTLLAYDHRRADRRGHRRLSRPAPAQDRCCASSPAARSTTASRR